MQVAIECRPAASVARLTLDRGEKVTCEVGSMVAMSSGINVETSSRTRGGGMLKGLKRMFGGESFFLNHFTAREPDQEILVAPGLAGDVVHHRLDGTMIAQSSSWLASGDGIEIDTTWQGFGKGVFGGEGMFWVECSGTGDLLLNSFGGIYTVDVEDEYVVDTGHIVAFEDTLSFKVSKAGSSLFGSLLGGEGLVCRFSGRGRLFCQSHHPTSFGRLLGPLLKPRTQ